jgi:predicted RNase H-like HicB family nuclease
MRGGWRHEEETCRNLEDALIAHFEAMRQAGEPIRDAHASVDSVEVAA